MQAVDLLFLFGCGLHTLADVAVQLRIGEAELLLVGEAAQTVDWRLFHQMLRQTQIAAGPSSYGLTDTMGRMHSDAQFAGSSSVPAHVEMMGLIGMGNNPMVGATVACAVAVEEALKK